MNDLVPSEFYLFQNYPNPFTGKTTIKYCVAYKTKVKITVFNSKGEVIENMVDEEKEAGTYKIEFNITVINRQLANGNYMYRLEAGKYTSNKQMILGR